MVSNTRQNVSRYNMHDGALKIKHVNAASEIAFCVVLQRYIGWIQ